MIDRRATPTWVRELLVLALLAGLVGMHQLVMPGAHHGATTSVVAVDHHHPEAPAGHTSMLEHLCLAVLVALATLAAALVVVLGTAPARTPGSARAPDPVLAGPAPVPVARRLAALQLLRL